MMTAHLAFVALLALGQDGGGKQTFKVGETTREGIVVANSKPAPTAGAPLVIVFHGHGGTAQGVAKRLHLHTLWPEAIVAYLQGIPGVKGITDAEGRQSGWQKNPGELDDRDLKFFDVALADLRKKHTIDPDRIYALGHSNGSRFAHVLWNQRGDKLAAICAACGGGGKLISASPPRSLFMIAGEKDQLVPLKGQLFSVELARKLLQTKPDQTTKTGFLTIEPGTGGLELATYIHPGGHEFPTEALPHVVRFFKKHAKK